MNLSLIRPIIVAILMATPALFIGCNHRAASKSAQPAKATPEDSFKYILETFRRQVEDQNISFVVTDGSSRTAMSGSNKVSSELFPPKNAGENYKAVVTVESVSQYSLRRSRSSDEIEREKKSKNQSSSSLVDSSEKKDIEVVDSRFAATSQDSNNQSSATTSAPPQETVQRRPDGEVRKYELVHDGDHWQLVTKLDPKTEQSIKFAFDEALSRQ
jgi:hypothetical protein